jgi:hypothetical protein
MALLATELAWALADFNLALDVTWRGAPLFSGLRAPRLEALLVHW